MPTEIYDLDEAKAIISWLEYEKARLERERDWWRNEALRQSECRREDLKDTISRLEKVLK